jgi:hypothetical protein
MKRVALLLLVLLIGTPVFADPVFTKNLSLNSTTAGDPYDLRGTGVKYNTLTWNNPGTVTTCTITLEKSPNGQTQWTALIASTSCTSSGSVKFTEGVANFVRVKLATYGGSGSITVRYDGDLALNAAAGTVVTSGTTQQTSGVSSTYSSDSVISAAIASDTVSMSFSGAILNNKASVTRLFLQIRTGTTVLYQYITRLASSAISDFDFTISSIRVPAGSAMAVRSYVEDDTGATVDIAWNLVR